MPVAPPQLRYQLHRRQRLHDQIACSDSPGPNDPPSATYPQTIGHGARGGPRHGVHLGVADPLKRVVAVGVHRSGFVQLDDDGGPHRYFRIRERYFQYV